MRVTQGARLIGGLGVTVTASYGILTYGFAAFIHPMGAELGWSKASITGAFSLAHLVAGGAAIPVGHWVDRHGARGVMTAGSVLAALLLLAWSRVASLPAFYAIWALMGVAMAGVLYEPAFAVITARFTTGRARALTALTFIGGFASVIFVPLATALVAGLGWRGALVVLSALYVSLTVPLHVAVLKPGAPGWGIAADERREWATASPGAVSRELGLAGGAPGNAPGGVYGGEPREVQSDAPPGVRPVLRTASFRWIAVAFTLASLATTAVTVHLVPLLLERGHGEAFAGGAMGMLGLMALPGRLIFTPLGERGAREAVTACVLALQAAGILSLLALPGAAGVWIFVALFGAGFGAITPARAALVGDLVGAAAFARMSGVLAFITSIARAVAPVGVSLLWHAGGGYDSVLWLLLALSLASAVSVLAAGRATVRPGRTILAERRA